MKIIYYKYIYIICNRGKSLNTLLISTSGLPVIMSNKQEKKQLKYMHMSYKHERKTFK